MFAHICAILTILAEPFLPVTSIPRPSVFIVVDGEGLVLPLVAERDRTRAVVRDDFDVRIVRDELLHHGARVLRKLPHEVVTADGDGRDREKDQAE